MDKKALYHSLVSSILVGERVPGDLLPSQRTLVHETGLSRSTVREVIQKMELDGLIQTHQGGRSVCNNLIQNRVQFDDVFKQGDLQFQKQVMEARAFLEGEAAFYAATRATDDQLARIGDEYIQMQARSQGLTTLNKAKADLKFHTIIAESCHHMLITAFSQIFYQRYFNAIYEVLDSTLKRHGRYPDGIRSQHELIYNALVRRDADAARIAAREHILYTKRLLDSD